MKISVVLSAVLTIDVTGLSYIMSSKKYRHNNPKTIINVSAVLLELSLLREPYDSMYVTISALANKEYK